MTISANFPNVQPSLLLDFANAKQLPPSVNFTRATTAAYYDGSTTAMAEQNLFTYSQNSTTNWTNFSNRLTITTSYETAPDGTNTGMRLQNSSGSIGYFYQNVGNNLFVSGTTYALSVWVKSNTGATQTAQLMLPVTSAVTNVTVTTSWTRVSWVTAASSTNSFAGIILDPATATDISVWGFQVEQRSSVTAYTATTTQAITNYIPVLLTAGGGQPRFDHNPTTSESLGLLIEEQRTNAFNYSANLGTSPWSLSSVTVDGNTIIAPDGTLTGDKIISDATNNVHYVRQIVGSSANYTFSCYFKAAEYSTVVMLGVSANHGAAFNLANGTVSATYGSATAAITAVGNGWYRCSTSLSVSGTDFYIYVNTASTYVGNAFGGIYAWGAQLEAGSFPTSYIPTTSAAATRAAELATMTGVNFSSWFNNSQGTFVTQFMMPSPTGQIRRLWDIENTNTATYANFIAFNGYSASNSIMYFEGGASGSNQFSIDTGSFAANTQYRVSMAYQVNDFAASTSGGAVSTDSTGTIGTGLNALWLGSHRDANWYNGYINKFAYYPVRVTNAQLQALSS